MAKLRRNQTHAAAGTGHLGIDFGQAIADETDRGCALITTEFLGDAIETYLTRLMTNKGGTSEEIKEFLVNLSAPLGNFSPRIKAIYWFGLVGKNTYGALENIRHIRNHCAHRAGPINMTDTVLEVHVRGLEQYLCERAAKYGDCDDILQAILTSKRTEALPAYSAPRLIFMKAGALTYMTLRVLAANPVESNQVAFSSVNDFIFGPW